MRTAAWVGDILTVHVIDNVGYSEAGANRRLDISNESGIKS